MAAIPPSDVLRVDRLDYIQRAGIPPPQFAPTTTMTHAPIAQRRLQRVLGVGRRPGVDATAAPLSDALSVPPSDALVGLYGHRTPMAYLVVGDEAGISLRLGTWTHAGDEPSETALAQHATVLIGALRSLYPEISLTDADGEMPNLAHAAMALGIPALNPGARRDEQPLDRLVRTMSGSRWATLVMAEPVTEAKLGSLRRDLIAEMRAVEAGPHALAAPSPLVRHYLELLNALLASLTTAQAIGAWRTAVYLMGDDASHPRLCAVWRSIFSSDCSLLEPVRIFDSPEAARFALDWAMPDDAGPSSPGRYQHPFGSQALLTSTQLAGYVNLPRWETSGFAVRTVPRFDVVPPSVRSRPTLRIGHIQDGDRATGHEYELALADLTRHAFVAGVTGAGKTTTMFQLLRQLVAAEVPFLVIEPAKSEYRGFLDVPQLGAKLRVFTPGRETVSPFRMNPLEAVSGTPVSVHIDLLRSAFAASFGMWTPLPQVLEMALHRAYRARGWDLTTNTNARVDRDDALADGYPTLSDLADAVDEVVATLGYEERVTADIRAALHTRLDGLRTGGKGRMLDTQRSLAVVELLEHPTVVELDGVGDDDDKAFLIGLLLIAIAEHRRAGEYSPRLRHLIVIEEAHRLLANVPSRRQEEADPRGKAVETFANLLAEIRAYGEGVAVVDQVPSKITADVLKNTNLKIIHRVVAADDRAVLAGATAMSQPQELALATLRRGQAVVFAEGDDAPIMVQVTSEGAQPRGLRPEDARVRAVMGASGLWRSRQEVFSPAPCCSGATGSHDMARSITADLRFRRTLSRTVLSLEEDPGALHRMWPDLIAAADAVPVSGALSDLLPCVLAQGAEWLMSHRGAQGGWPYSTTRRLVRDLTTLLLSTLERGDWSAAGAFRAVVINALQKRQDSLRAAGLICIAESPFEPKICLAHEAAADLVACDFLGAQWKIAERKDLSSPEGARAQTWQVCLDAAYELVEFPEPDWPVPDRQRASDAARRAGLCFGQQMLMADRSKSTRTIRQIMAKLAQEAQR